MDIYKAYLHSLEGTYFLGMQLNHTMLYRHHFRSTEVISKCFQDGTSYFVNSSQPL